MIHLKSTPNHLAVRISGDYDDLHSLWAALHACARTDIMFRPDAGEYHSEQEAEYRLNGILSLCYDLRKAFQGRRGMEVKENPYDFDPEKVRCELREVEGRLQDLPKYDDMPTKAEIDSLHERKELLQAADKPQLLMNVDVVYPWFIYLLFELDAITARPYDPAWFENSSFPPAASTLDLLDFRYQVQQFAAQGWKFIGEDLDQPGAGDLCEIAALSGRNLFWNSCLYAEAFCHFFCNLSASTQQRQQLICLFISQLLGNLPTFTSTQIVLSASDRKQIRESARQSVRQMQENLKEEKIPFFTMAQYSRDIQRLDAKAGGEPVHADAILDYYREKYGDYENIRL